MKPNHDYKGNSKDSSHILKTFIKRSHSGSGSGATQVSAEENLITDGTYQCPMKHEGAKTYKKPGKCPVCNMHMVPEGCGFLYY